MASESTDKALSPKQGKILNDKISTLNESLATIKQTYFGVIAKVGWYRIARYNAPHLSGAQGSYDNSVDILIKRAYGYEQPEHLKVSLVSSMASSKLIPIDKAGANITTIHCYIFVQIYCII